MNIDYTVGEVELSYKPKFKNLHKIVSSEDAYITETSVDVRVILQAALLTNSVALVLAHNHPSGNLRPSRQDMEITKQVKEAAKLIRITVIDHLILTDAGYYSFSDEGQL